MLEEFLGQEVVVDLRSPFVCLGTLTAKSSPCSDVRNCFPERRDMTFPPSGWNTLGEINAASAGVQG